MHEWALAEAVLATVEKIRREQGGGAVRSVRVGIGELQAVDLEAFRLGLSSLLEGSDLAPEVFQFQKEAASFRCNRCAAEWLLTDQGPEGEEAREAIHFLPEAAYVYLRCPSCGSPDFRLQAGRGVSIQEVELEGGGD